MWQIFQHRTMRLRYLILGEGCVWPNGHYTLILDQSTPQHDPATLPYLAFNGLGVAVGHYGEVDQSFALAACNGELRDLDLVSFEELPKACKAVCLHAFRAFARQSLIRVERFQFSLIDAPMPALTG